MLATLVRCAPIREEFAAMHAADSQFPAHAAVQDAHFLVDQVQLPYQQSSRTHLAGCAALPQLTLCSCNATM